MSSYYSDIFEVLQQLERETESRERFLSVIPEARAKVYSHLFPKRETFMPLEEIDGSISLIPGNQVLSIYRGQVQDFPSCVSRIYRGQSTIYDLFEARLKQKEFELVIEDHPAVHDLIKRGIHVSFAGLAQHYGFRTEFLDVTSDPMVAAFFAVCRYSRRVKGFLTLQVR